MKEIIILGTGVHGGEMAEIIERINDVGKSWKLLGFITTDSTRVGEVFNGYCAISCFKWYTTYV